MTYSCYSEIKLKRKKLLHQLSSRFICRIVSELMRSIHKEIKLHPLRVRIDIYCWFYALSLLEYCPLSLSNNPERGAPLHNLDNREYWLKYDKENKSVSISFWNHSLQHNWTTSKERKKKGDTKERKKGNKISCSLNNEGDNVAYMGEESCQLSCTFFRMKSLFFFFFFHHLSQFFFLFLRIIYGFLGLNFFYQ